MDTLELTVDELIFQDISTQSVFSHPEIFMNAFLRAGIDDWQNVATWAYQKFVDEGSVKLPEEVKDYCLDYLAGRISL